MGQLAPGEFKTPVYLINLDRAPERLAGMEAMLADLSLPFERVPAVDGRQLSDPIAGFSERSYRMLHGRRRNPGEIGCYLSHVECARRLLASGAEHALVLEDDVSLPDDIHAIVKAAIEADGDWDILRLSSVNSGRKFEFRKLTPTRSLAICLTREKGSGAYMINRRAARWFVDALQPMRLPFDIAFDLEYLAGLKAAFVFPVPVSQETGLVSQIQSHRRAFHLSRWHYAIVQPYRAWLETTRLVVRLAWLTTHLFRKTTNPSGEMSEGRVVDDSCLRDMAIQSEHLTKRVRMRR